MKAGLIPPIPDLDRTEHDFHLVLLHLLTDIRYLSWYRRASQRGDYVILDNGAHELGASLQHDYLLEMARGICADEVVLPDVLFDRRGTVERTKRMLKWICTPMGWECHRRAGEPRYMFVPQGEDRSDWAVCLHDLIGVWDQYSAMAPGNLKPPVIGISKDYDNWRGGLHYLIGHYVEPIFLKRERMGWDIHCLGWPNDLWSTAKVARNFPWVRSTDSAKAFVYAKNHILLEPGGPIPQYPRRDPNYFNEPLTSEQWEIAVRNILVFRATAIDEIITPV